MDKKILNSIQTLETASLEDLKKLKQTVSNAIFVDLPGPFGQSPEQTAWAVVSFMDLGKRNLEQFYILAVTAFLYRAMNEYDAPSDDERMAVKRFLDSIFSYDPLRHAEHSAADLQEGGTTIRANMLLRGMNSTSAMGIDALKTAVTKALDLKGVEPAGAPLLDLVQRIAMDPSLYRVACGIINADRDTMSRVLEQREGLEKIMITGNGPENAMDTWKLVQSDPRLRLVWRSIRSIRPELVDSIFAFRDRLSDLLNPIADLGLLEDGIPPKDTIRSFGSFVNVNREPLHKVMSGLGVSSYPPFRCLGVWDSMEPMGEDDARAKFNSFCASNKSVLSADCALVPFGKWVVVDDTRGNTRNVILSPNSLAGMINENIEKDNSLAEAMIKRKVEKDQIANYHPAAPTDNKPDDTVDEYKAGVGESLRSAHTDAVLSFKDREAIKNSGGSKHVLACMKLLADLEEERTTVADGSERALEIDKDIEELKLTLKNPDADLIIPVVKIDVENMTITKEHI